MTFRALSPQRNIRLWGVALLAVMLVHHIGLWLAIVSSRGVPLLVILNRWDAENYTIIARGGQQGPLFAFFPFYPHVVGFLARVLGVALHPAVIGTLLSTAALLAFVLLVTRASDSSDTRLKATFWGLFLVLYSPASYTLHTHHTEGIFIFLSFLAFTFGCSGRALLAGLFTGLALWTRNQGLFVAGTVLLLLWGLHRQGRLPLTRFFSSAALMGVFGLAFLGFQWVAAGSPFAFLKAQEYWTHVTSVSEFFRGLWLGNPWQLISQRDILRLIWFYGVLGFSIAYFRRDKVFGAYCLLSLVPIFFQGHSGNIFRFSVVLFPLWFWLGQKLERAPGWTQLTVAVALVALNNLTAWNYAFRMWAY